MVYISETVEAFRNARNGTQGGDRTQGQLPQTLTGCLSSDNGGVIAGVNSSCRNSWRSCISFPVEDSTPCAGSVSRTQALVRLCLQQLAIACEASRKLCNLRVTQTVAVPPLSTISEDLTGRFVLKCENGMNTGIKKSKIQEFTEETLKFEIYYKKS